LKSSQDGAESKSLGGSREFSTKWQTSPRKYGIRIDRDVAIPVREGVTLDSDIFLPDAPGKFPALLAVHAYSKAAQAKHEARITIHESRIDYLARRDYIATTNGCGLYLEPANYL
jgi:predicted acyl esterase